MIKKLRVTVDGKPYEVTVEVEDDAPRTSGSPSPLSGPVVEAPPVASTAPALTESGTTLDAIVSPLSGRVTAITVKIGQEVKQGEHVLTLEAMKMNTFVFAQKGGKAKEIKVAVGDAVHENQPLIILDS